MVNYWKKLKHEQVWTVSFANKGVASWDDGLCLPSGEPTKHESTLWRGTLQGLSEFLLFWWRKLFHCFTPFPIGFQMAAAASNKNSTKSTISYPEIEEEALQFILDSFESSISKYTKYIEVSLRSDLISLLIDIHMIYCDKLTSFPIFWKKKNQGQSDDLVSVNAKQANRRLLLKQLAKDLCISERRILYRTQYVKISIYFCFSATFLWFIVLASLKIT